MNRVLYQESNYPILQNRVYETYEEATNCSQGDIRIVEDQFTGLIYNEAFRPELMQYDSNYNNEQAFSPYFKQHLRSVKEIIRRELGTLDLVEVGCGKGYFLEMLEAEGFNITGFDPTYEGNNPRIIKDFFKPGMFEPSRGLILRHVLEHIPDPYSFLCELRDANGGGGLIYVEVPCFDWICDRRTWFDIFYEHVNYFRMIDFKRIFGKIQFAERTFGGQYLSIIADLSSLEKPKYDRHNSVLFPKNFQNSLTQRNATQSIVWGAASKGVIFSLLSERNGKPISAVVDVNPLKQGKFLPITGLKVLTPDEVVKQFPEGTTVYIMNSNYINEIKEMSLHQFNYVGVDQ
jgi:SAM-dependent methyltransferase